MTGPTTIDEIPWSDGEEPKEELRTAKPRRCKHPRENRIRGTLAEIAVLYPSLVLQSLTVPVGEAIGPLEVCVRCGHVFDAARQKRGRNVRKYGKREELADARILGLEPRGTSRDPEDSGGALDPAVVQSKTGPIHYPAASWIAELEALGRIAAGRPRILVATPKTGPGIKRRKVAVLYLDELQELTGLSAERKALLELREAVRPVVRAARIVGVSEGESLGRVAAALEEADRWKR